MARTFGKLLCEVWDDPKHEDFLTLSSDAKVLYWAFCSQRDITAAGVVPLTPRRWRKWFGGDTAAPERALDELVDRGFVMVDDDTAEVWVRSFIKYDGRLENSKLSKSVDSAVEVIRSKGLRRACERRLNVLRGGSDDGPDGTADAGPVDNFDDPTETRETPGRRPFEGQSKGEGMEPGRDPELLDLDLDLVPGTFDPDLKPRPSVRGESQSKATDNGRTDGPIGDVIELLSARLASEHPSRIPGAEANHRAVIANDVATKHGALIAARIAQLPNSTPAVIAESLRREIQ